ncbi:MAG: hypothetical protein DMG36_07255 [Acidobacteria bacterium]|nr:MAG: hypothetical protein DMG36_07255 [Acidobacteriota bacterium]
MTLLDPPPVKPQKSRAMAFTVAAVTLAAIVTLWFVFRYYPEKRAAERFFDALAAGNINLAYQLWNPGPSYTMKDFVADWGPEGYYGPVKSYEILKTSSPHGANAVDVRVAVSPFSPVPDASDPEKSRKTKVVSVWVVMSDKSLSFPP